MEQKLQTQETYDASAIETFDGLNAIRMRPEMYVGDLSNGLQQTIEEVIDNSCDEWKAGFCNRIWLHMDTKTKTVTVTDNGRGIPVDKHPVKKISALTLLLTHTHAGGKFNSSAYKSAKGLHGVGLKAVNALSSQIEVFSKRNGILWQQVWNDIVATTPEPVQVSLGTNQLLGGLNSGTCIKWTVSPDFITPPHTWAKQALEWCQELIYLCQGLTMEITIDNKDPIVLHQPGGLQTYCSELFENQGVQPDHPLICIDTEQVQCYFAWSKAARQELYSYANRSFTHEGGYHVTGFRKAISAAFVPYTNGRSFDNADLRDGLVGVLHVSVPNPRFQGQVKHKLAGPPEAESLVYSAVLSALSDYLGKNVAFAESLIAKAVAIRALRDKSKKDLDAIKAVVSTTAHSRGLPPKATCCPSVTVAQREIFYVEGDSAGGTLKQARSQYQEVMPLRGKISNAIRTKAGPFLSNKEIQGLMAMIGGFGANQTTGEVTFDVSKVRSHKHIVMADADPDGAHIRALILSFMANYCWDLLASGYVYICESPLFMGSIGATKQFGDSIQEIYDKFGLPTTSKKVQINRMKGWGSANPSDLRVIATDPTQRKLTQINVNDNSWEELLLYMGDDVSARKVLLGVA